MAKNEKKQLEKKNWKQQFMLVGEAKINDYTYGIDKKSEKSDWVYNQLNLGVDCGAVCGTVYAEMMGGYGAERDNVVYVIGKKDDGTIDTNNKFTIDWDDRFDETILESVADTCFITVGLEKDKSGKTFAKKFISPYDAIAYIKENLEDGTVVNVKGNIEYSVYNENVQMRKRITSVFLSNADDVSKYDAKFTQTVLLQKDSMGKIDKDKSTIPLYATVIEYQKMWKDKEVKQLIPLRKTFEYEIDMNNEKGTKTLIEKYLKVKKGVTEIAFDGRFIESGALVTMTVEDLPDDIKELIEIGAYTEEEALAKCADGSGKEKRMVFLRPNFRMVETDGVKTPVVSKIEQKYSDEDLLLDFLIDDEQEEPKDDELPFDVNNKEDDKVESDDDSSWLDEL